MQLMQHEDTFKAMNRRVDPKNYFLMEGNQTMHSRAIISVIGSRELVLEIMHLYSTQYNIKAQCCCPPKVELEYSEALYSVSLENVFALQILNFLLYHRIYFYLIQCLKM